MGNNFESLANLTKVILSNRVKQVTINVGSSSFMEFTNHFIF